MQSHVKEIRLRKFKHLPWPTYTRFVPYLASGKKGAEFTTRWCAEMALELMETQERILRKLI